MFVRLERKSVEAVPWKYIQIIDTHYEKEIHTEISDQNTNEENKKSFDSIVRVTYDLCRGG